MRKEKTCFFVFNTADLMDNMFLADWCNPELFREGQWLKARYFQLLENASKAPDLACNAIMTLKFMGNIRTKVL